MVRPTCQSVDLVYGCQWPTPRTEPSRPLVWCALPLRRGTTAVTVTSYSAFHDSLTRPSQRILRNPRHRQHYPVHHIDRGVEILAACDQLGFLTHGQITRLLFANVPNRRCEGRTYHAAERACATSLQRLWQAGLLNHQPLMLTSRPSGFGYNHIVNRSPLKAQGRSNSTSTPLVRVRYARPGMVSRSAIKQWHSLSINEFFVLAQRASELHDIGIHDWLDDRHLGFSHWSG
ncbi:hypothetical protein BH23CHL5_BH23CHL5_03090 [soil metagenome]